MSFQKPTPKWFLVLYSIMISFLAVYSILLLANDRLGSINFNTYSLFFTLFSIIMVGFFLGKKYELRSWAVPLAYLVFGFVAVSIINTFSLYIQYEAIYFLNFIKSIFFLLFVLLVDILYLHPHVKHVPGFQKLAEAVIAEAAPAKQRTRKKASR
jgi:hypothetical protein